VSYAITYVYNGHLYISESHDLEGAIAYLNRALNTGDVYKIISVVFTGPANPIDTPDLKAALPRCDCQ
jgi:hypothetical protein